METTQTQVPDRRATLADAALAVLETEGGRGLTHRAVDRRADLPQGSTSNYFKTREALLTAALLRLVELERPAVEAMEALVPDGPYAPHRAAELVAEVLRGWLTPDRAGLALARYELFLEARSTRFAASIYCWPSSCCPPRAVAIRTVTRRSCSRYSMG